MCCMWARIWWVRPVSSSHSRSATLGVREITRMRVCEGRPAPPMVMRMRSVLWRKIGSSMSKDPSCGNFGEWRTMAR